MNGKNRISAAMNFILPDRVPLMCQLSIGHYFLHSGIDPVEIWLTSEGFADALISLQRRYNFDGILVNLPGRDPNIKYYINSLEKENDQIKIKWKNNCYTIFPKDDLPQYYQPNHEKFHVPLEKIDPDKLFYLEPWDVSEMTYPYRWALENHERNNDNFFPDYHLDTIKIVQQKTKGEISIHSEVYSPWSQLMELVNYEDALIALIEEPEKVKLLLNLLSEGTIELGRRQAVAGVDAILISSAYAGAGLISREHYEEFILPYEKKVIEGIREKHDIIVYTHTCGAIGDRLDLMLATGTKGIDTLDPPPIGTVELEEAKNFLQGKAFIKGNIDPVNTLLNGSKEEVIKDVEWRIKTAKPGGGFILSSACSVAPHTPQDNMLILSELIDKYGYY